jgi:exosome complex RNA-binding protein Csl4
MDGQTLAESLSKQELAERILKAERRIDCVETTLAAVTDEIEGVSLSSRCSKCEQSLLLIKHGMLYCPNCGDGHSL